MTIRPADPCDLDPLVVMSRQFHDATPYRDAFAFNEAQVRKTLSWLFSHGIVYVAEKGREGCEGFLPGPRNLVANVIVCATCGAPQKEHELTGMIGLVIVPHMVSGLTTASELFWWVDPSARGIGLKLLRAAEAWAEGEGAEVIHLIAPDERAGELYTRLGYSRLETMYQRRFAREG